MAFIGKLIDLDGRAIRRIKEMRLRTVVMIVVLAGAPVAAIVASADTGPQPAQANDTKTTRCVAPNSIGTNLVFNDGSNLFDMIAVIRCALDTDFGVRTLQKGERHTCYDKQGKTELVVHGYNSSVVACGSGQIVVPANAAYELHKLGREMRWFLLAGTAARNLANGDDLWFQMCAGGYVVGSQPGLDATRLIADARARQTSESDIDKILVGISLALNYQSVATCADPPQLWYQPNAEVIPSAAGPGSNSPGASAQPQRILEIISKNERAPAP